MGHIGRPLRDNLLVQSKENGWSCHHDKEEVAEGWYDAPHLYASLPSQMLSTMLLHDSSLAGKHRGSLRLHSMMAFYLHIHHTNMLPAAYLREGRNGGGDRIARAGIYRCNDELVTVVGEMSAVVDPDSGRRGSNLMSLLK